MSEVIVTGAAGFIGSHLVDELLGRGDRVLGIDDEEQAENFGHILGAFQYGAPPHGGIALGLDLMLFFASIKATTVANASASNRNSADQTTACACRLSVGSISSG